MKKINLLTMMCLMIMSISLQIVKYKGYMPDQEPYTIKTEISN